MNVAIIVLYLLAMLAFGWWGRTRTATAGDYLVAGRRLGPLFYTGTMSALVLGSASTVGGVGLGYKFGLGGIWLVVSIGVGVILLSLLFAGRIQRLRIFTVTQMLTLRYGFPATRVSSIVMAAYTLMLVVTSTSAYAAVFTVLFGVDRWVGVLLGGVVVLVYSSIGGMWSITLTDLVQFALMTVGIIGLMLPFSLAQAGGWSGLQSRLDASYFDLGSHGGEWIVTQFVIFTFGLLIGQDIWQRVFTARSDSVARWGGVSAGVYTIVYGVAGAIAGMSAAVLLPGIKVRDEVFVALADQALPVGIGGLVMAAGVAAMMSTASGALIACATVTRVDILPVLAGRRGAAPRDDDEASNLDRLFVVLLGLLAIAITLLVDDVVSALTIAYDILVGGLLVSILGGLLWKRGTGAGAVASMVVGTVTVLVAMWTWGVLANEPIYYGLVLSAIAYVVVSLLTRRTDPEVQQAWERRLATSRTQDVTEAAPTP